MASSRVNSLNLYPGPDYLLTFCFEACVGKIVGFGSSFTNFQLGFLEILSLFILLFATQSHSSSV